MMHAQSQPYPQTAACNAPAALPFLTRLDTLAIDLLTLQDKLAGFGERLAGTPPETNASGGHAPGIDGAVSAAEARVRECHRLVDVLHKAF